MSRLFTHHDQLVLVGKVNHGEGDDDSAPTHNKGGLVISIPHFHKVSGLLSLLNLLLYVTPLYGWAVGTIGWDKMFRLSLVHPILALSSFEFTVPRQRSSIYTLYKEMQMHAVVFTMRSFAVYTVAYLGITNIWLRCLACLMWHPLADWVTANYAPPSGETTIRRAVKGEAGYKEYGLPARMGVAFMTSMQLVGTYMMMSDSNDAARMAMCVMGPVQVSSLLATLVRKGYASSKTNVILYALILTPILFAHTWALFDVFALAAIIGLRFKLRLNKYVLWTLVTIVLAVRAGDPHVNAVVNEWVPTLSRVLPEAAI